MTEQIKSVIQSLNSNQVLVVSFSFIPIKEQEIYNGVFVQGGELDTLDGMTPLDAVVRILNNQLTSLMWIDEKVCIFLCAVHLAY